MTNPGPKPRPLLDRFMEKIEKLPSGCWRWLGSTNGMGYGQIWDLIARRKRYAHLFAYRHFVGPIPTGHVLDHICEFVSCVNPAHLRPVTQAVNRALAQSGRRRHSEPKTVRSRMPRLSMEERFWKKVERDKLGCWMWIAAKDGNGYGMIRATNRGRSLRAHVYSYTLHVAPVPKGLVLDHLCRNRACVRPDHLEPVTHAENMARSEAPHNVLHRRQLCNRGHSVIGRNRLGSGRCAECHKRYMRDYRKRRRWKNVH